MIIPLYIRADDAVISNPNGTYKQIETEEELLHNWGRSNTVYKELPQFMVDVPDILLFGLLTTQFPNGTKMMWNVKHNTVLFFTTESSIYSHFNNQNTGVYGSVSPSPYNTCFAEDAETSTEEFCYVISDDCTQDYVDIIQPYMDLFYSQNLEEMINSVAALTNQDHPVPDRYGAASSSYKRKYILENTEIYFWEFFNWDVYNGTMFKKYNARYPNKCAPLCRMLCSVITHWQETGEEYYDPFNN